CSNVSDVFSTSQAAVAWGIRGCATGNLPKEQENETNEAAPLGAAGLVGDVASGGASGKHKVLGIRRPSPDSGAGPSVAPSSGPRAGSVEGRSRRRRQHACRRTGRCRRGSAILR